MGRRCRKDAWFAGAGLLPMDAWRSVESRSSIATLRLVQTMEEHEALEAMPEASKPPKPEAGHGLHYLLFTPFRYTSPTASRFRQGGEPGIWYGADSVQTACAEIACWRTRFILDLAGLAKDDAELVTSHTVFRATVSGTAIDLTSPPWSAKAEFWTHLSDYASTQALAAEVRRRDLEWIRCASGRNPDGSCAAVVSVSALSATTPSDEQEWACRATRTKVIFHNRRSGMTYSWDA